MLCPVRRPVTAESVRAQLAERSAACEAFFAAEARRLALLCRDMARRFRNGGRLLAFGSGCDLTDAQHVSVEFVHPVIVGKRALPALDVSSFSASSLDAIVSPPDIVMAFGPRLGESSSASVLRRAKARGAMTIALPGPEGDYHCPVLSPDPFVHQEIVEVLYHTLWETVHVFLERRELGVEAGDAAFLYPFLGSQPQDSDDLVSEAADSIRMKAADDSTLRALVAEEDAETIVQAARSIFDRIARGGKLILFGNGGSATDANDLCFDCLMPPSGVRPVPAISLSLEPATLTAIANDVGIQTIFLRQLIAHAQPADIAFGISTSGGSANVVDALAEARRRGLLTVALLGGDGGDIVRRRLADFALVVRSSYIPRIQEVQASIYHILRRLLENYAST